MFFKLLNYDHGNKSPEIFFIGPFKIEITKQHCQNLSHLPKNESITFGYNEDYLPIVIKNSRIRGGWIETAQVTINDNDISLSVLYPPNSGRKNTDDLLLLLSFISGRAVTSGIDPLFDFLNPEEHSDKVLHHGHFSRNSFNWNSLKILREQGLAGQFYNLTMAYQNKDLVARAVYVNNALNVSYDKWHKQNPLKINKKISSDLSSTIRECLEKQKVDSETFRDINSRATHICSPSAIKKLKHFLQGIYLYPKYDNKEMHERLKWLNVVRNSMVHTGMLPKYYNLTDEILGEATSSAIELVLRINQYFFGKMVLNLSDPYLDFIKGLILPYFHEGIFCGKQIFNEKYDEYIERPYEKWTF
jgi:hypothetical protein